MSSKLVFVFVLAIAAAAPALSQVLPSPTTPAVAGVVAAKTVKEHVICRTTETTGSRLNATRQCATQTEWERMNREQRETLERQQSGGSHTSPGGL
jgi:hypothetical protein